MWTKLQEIHLKDKEGHNFCELDLVQLASGIKEPFRKIGLQKVKGKNNVFEFLIDVIEKKKEPKIILPGQKGFIDGVAHI